MLSYNAAAIDGQTAIAGKAGSSRVSKPFAVNKIPARIPQTTMSTRPVIATAGNVMAPALAALRGLGYVVSRMPGDRSLLKAESAEVSLAAAGLYEQPDIQHPLVLEYLGIVDEIEVFVQKVHGECRRKVTLKGAVGSPKN